MILPMSDLFAARTQMAVSLGFHIIFAAISVAMPFLMAIAHFLYLRTQNDVYLQLTKKWSKGVAIFFATGAVSGTALSFELGLLWPKFMEHAGPVIGMPFSWEGTAFFLEAIFIGIYLYGWEKVSPWIHWGSGVIVGVCGVISSLFVICVNSWMNGPTGFDWVNGEAIHIDPVRAMFNPGALHQGLHMAVASFAATGFAVAGLHAFGLLKNPRSEFHRKALRIALWVGALASIIQPLQGDRLAKQVAILQPIKLAAMESLFHTAQPALLLLGGIPSEADGTVYYGIHLPRLLSFLAHGDFSAEVKGLDAFPKENWPPVLVTHFAFQIMVGLGTLMMGISFLAGLFFWRQPKLLDHPTFLKLLAIAAPAGFIAIEAGWTVTEVGRQPWIIYGIMKTRDALTPMPGLIYPMLLFFALYLLLSFVVTWLMIRQFRNVR